MLRLEFFFFKTAQVLIYIVYVSPKHLEPLTTIMFKERLTDEEVNECTKVQ